MIVKDEDAKRVQDELLKLRNENHDLKEQIQNYIPRRRVRRVYKQLKKILEQDLIEHNTEYINYLKALIDRYKDLKNSDAKTAVILVDDAMIAAIENLIGFYEPDERYNKGE